MQFVWCFFFKQKTAYEMRISDWSSDVCSSDLARGNAEYALHCRMESAVDGDGSCSPHCNACGLVWFDRDIETAITRGGGMRHDVVVDPDDRITDFEVGRGRTRSEEHTSELQSLMRISYAVFCLKKKKQTAHTAKTSSRKCI